jgi:hypothetical protein
MNIILKKLISDGKQLYRNQIGCFLEVLVLLKIKQQRIKHSAQLSKVTK